VVGRTRRGPIIRFDSCSRKQWRWNHKFVHHSAVQKVAVDDWRRTTGSATKNTSSGDDETARALREVLKTKVKKRSRVRNLFLSQAT